MNLLRSKWLLIMILSFVVFGLAGTTLIRANESAGDADLYYPMNLGNYWIYTVTLPDKTTFERATQVIYPDEGYIRTMYLNAGYIMATFGFTKNSQGLFKSKQITMMGVVKFDPPQMVLSSKMTVGSSWSWTSTENPKVKETLKVLGTEQVTVPVGTFDALIVQYEGVDADGKAYNEKTWWVKNVGYVKSVQVLDGKTITFELKEYKLY